MSDSEDHKEVNNNLNNSQFGGGLINADNVTAGRIGGDIHNTQNFVLRPPQVSKPVREPARPKLQKSLLDQVKYEVGERLKQSLHNKVLIKLGKELQPKQVKRLWDEKIKIGLKDPEPLREDTSISQVFYSEDIAGKLLILGEPGSGKTTTQLELAKFLVERAQTDLNCPIPVLLNLSSWKVQHQSLIEWLLNELLTNYGVGSDLGKKWMKDCQLLPLLDGLDELKPVHQEACVKKINQFLGAGYRPINLVICSRTEEYNSLATRLELNGAIYLQPLTHSQIRRYLADINHVNLWSIIKDNPELLELVRTPLVLSVTIFTLKQKFFMREWKKLNSNEERLDYLINAYVQRMLGRLVSTIAYAKQKPLSEKQTQRWLIWLAQQMQRESKSEFLIERMQPNYLGNSTQRLEFWLLTGLGYGLLVGLITGLSGGLIFGLAIGMIAGFLALVGTVVSNKIEIFETLQWSWKRARNNLVLGLSFGVVFGLVCGAIGNDPIAGLGFGFYVGLITGFVVCLSSGFKASEDIEKKRFPNQGIWRTLSNAVFIGMIGGLIGGLIGMLFHKSKINQFIISQVKNATTGGLFSILDDNVINMLLGGLIGLIGTSLACGGGGCIEHFALRLTLYFNGCIPWNYASFLNDATDCVFFQRVGGRYRFIHKMLQDHLASRGNKHTKTLLKNGLRVSRYPFGKSGY